MKRLPPILLSSLWLATVTALAWHGAPASAATQATTLSTPAEAPLAPAEDSPAGLSRQDMDRIINGPTDSRSLFSKFREHRVREASNDSSDDVQVTTIEPETENTPPPSPSDASPTAKPTDREERTPVSAGETGIL